MDKLENNRVTPVSGLYSVASYDSNPSPPTISAAGARTTPLDQYLNMTTLLRSMGRRTTPKPISSIKRPIWCRLSISVEHKKKIPSRSLKCQVSVNRFADDENLCCTHRPESGFNSVADFFEEEKIVVILLQTFPHLNKTKTTKKIFTVTEDVLTDDKKFPIKLFQAPDKIVRFVE